MPRWRTWLPPALLAVAQVVVWPGLAFGRGGLDPVRATAGVAVVALIAAALLGRHRRPVVAAAVVAAGGGLAAWVAPGDELAVISLADLVALFGVAVRCSRRTTVRVLGGLVLWQAVLLAADAGAPGDYLAELSISAVVYLLVAASGRVRRRWHADRAAAARRLAAAERARQEAAAAERRRLARELHDVTAHHLTSIVINASAAQLLADGRPELRGEALQFAARTGRETLVALHRLVAILPYGQDPGAGPPPGLADLADDFRQLGQVITVDIVGTAPAAYAEALHGIAREALTNTLRYAPGGQVRLSVSCGPDGTELVVDDDGTASAAVTGLGGGRGLAGMRERAAALGGTLQAGPRDTGGWRVRAVLPPAASGPSGRARLLRRWLRSERVLDAAVALLALVLPLTGFAVVVEEKRPAPAAATLILLALIAHAVPLLWRRHQPWPALAAVVLTFWLGPLLVVARQVPTDGGWLFLPAVGVDLAAVYAVAAYGARPRLTWIAPLVAPVSAAFALAVLLIADPPDGETPGDGAAATALTLLVLTVLANAVLALPFGGSWLAGFAARRRRQRRLDREEAAVAAVAAQAEWRARDERARVAAGLSNAVLWHAARIPRQAEEDDLTAVLDSARASLAAMRALLDGLGSRPGTEPEVPSSSSV